MADKVLDAKIQTRSDTEANFMSENPILLEGEMAISTDKGGKYKVGDGVNAWNDLTYNTAEVALKDEDGNYLLDTSNKVTKHENIICYKNSNNAFDIERHNYLFRGKRLYDGNITDEYTFMTKVANPIMNDRFHNPNWGDVYIGDSLLINNEEWIVAGINYFRSRIVAYGDSLPWHYYGKGYVRHNTITVIPKAPYSCSNERIPDIGDHTNGYKGSTWGSSFMANYESNTKHFDQIFNNFLLRTNEIVSTNCGTDVIGPTSSDYLNTKDGGSRCLQTLTSMQAFGYTPYSNPHNIGHEDRKLPIFNFIDPMRFLTYYTPSSNNYIHLRDCNSDGFYFIGPEGFPTTDLGADAVRWFIPVMHLSLEDLSQSPQ